jgi:hypothetical protein
MNERVTFPSQTPMNDTSHVSIIGAQTPMNDGRTPFTNNVHPSSKPSRLNEISAKSRPRPPWQSAPGGTHPQCRQQPNILQECFLTCPDDDTGSEWTKVGGGILCYPGHVAITPYSAALLARSYPSGTPGERARLAQLQKRR